MAENDPPAAPTPTTAPAEPATPGSRLPTTQEELDKLFGARLHEERAKFADFEEYKAAAERLKAIEEASKTELEKAADKAAKAVERAEKAEWELAELKAASRLEAWRQAASKKTGVPAEALHGSTEEEVMALAESLRRHFTATPVVPGGGEPPTPAQPGDFLRDGFTNRR